MGGIETMMVAAWSRLWDLTASASRFVISLSAPLRSFSVRFWLGSKPDMRTVRLCTAVESSTIMRDFPKPIACFLNSDYAP